MPRKSLPESFYKMPRWVRQNFQPKRKETLSIDYTKYELNEDRKWVHKETKEPLKEEAPEVTDFYNANLLSSKNAFGNHYVVLDIDVPIHVEPSSTPGHQHVYINHILSHQQMEKLLDVLIEVGIMQSGIKDLQWDRFGEVVVRPPWVKKGDDRSFLGQENNELTAEEKNIIQVLKKSIEIHQEALDNESMFNDATKQHIASIIEEYSAEIEALEARQKKDA